mgnify:CR=1 FL=1
MFLQFYNNKSHKAAAVLITRAWTAGGGDELHVQFPDSDMNFFLPYVPTQGFLIDDEFYDSVEITGTARFSDLLDPAECMKSWFSPNR